MNKDLNPYIVPSEVLEAANLISNWAKKNNHKDWQLMGVCDRSFALRANSAYNAGLAAAENLVKEFPYLEESETILCGLENSKKR